MSSRLRVHSFAVLAASALVLVLALVVCTRQTALQASGVAAPSQVVQRPATRPADAVARDVPA